jgi:hypothetical protein
MSSVLQQILDHVSEFGDRLDDLDERLSSIESTSTPTPAPEETTTGEEYPPGEPVSGEDMSGGEPSGQDIGTGEVEADDEEVEKAGNGADYDIGDILETIGQAIQVMFREIHDIKESLGAVQKANIDGEEEYPDDGYEDEEYSQEPEPDQEEDVEKGCGIKKALPNQEIINLKERNAKLEAELADVMKKARPRDAPVIVTEEKIMNTKGSGANPVSLIQRFYGGI